MDPYDDLKPNKVGHGNLFVLCDQGSLVGQCVRLCVQWLRFVPP